MRIMVTLLVYALILEMLRPNMVVGCGMTEEIIGRELINKK